MTATNGVILASVLITSSIAASRLDAGTGVTLYVDDDAAPGGNGLSWAGSFRDLQDALSAARVTPNVSEIRVGQGIYRPDRGNGVKLGDRNAAFDLVNVVVLRGGYAGLGARNPSELDWEKYITTLSGDLLENDEPGFVNFGDNSYRVIRSTRLEIDTLLDGFTVTGSERNVSDALIGGGLFCLEGGLRVHHCRFEHNRAYKGGGVGVKGADIEIRHCVFLNNSATDGAGGYVGDALPQGSMVVEDCAFSNNVAFPEDGGALQLRGADIVRRCTFVNNYADDGGAIRGGLRVEDCTFTGNFGDYGGAVGRGGGDYVRCWFEDNHAGASGGAYGTVSANSQFHNAFIDCTFIGNTSGSNAGGAAYGGRAFINCRFINNRSGINLATPSGPGGVIHAHAPVLVAGCTFSGNSAAGSGGAINIPSASGATIVNCTFSTNTAVFGGTGAAIHGPATIINSVFGSHTGLPVASPTSITYSLLPNAMAGEGNIAGDPLFMNALGADGIAGTLDDDLRLQPNSPCIDAGDSSALPADEFDLDGDGNLAEPLPLDLEGNTRALEFLAAPNGGLPNATGVVVDMGAHEHRRPQDLAPAVPPAGDGIVDVNDLLILIGAWGECPPQGFCAADLDADGFVGLSDLISLIVNWGP